MSTTNTNLKDILSAIDDVNSKEYAFHVYVPSLKKEVPFLQINTGQQKTLIKSIIDSPVYNTEFIFTMRNIIKENCKDSSVNIDSLTLFDKLIICLTLRSKSIDSTYEMSIEHQGAELKHAVELDPLIETSKSVEVGDGEVVEAGHFRIELAPPTIGREYAIEKQIRSKNKAEDNIQSTEELRSVVGEAFITELIKYIKTFTIIQEESEATIDFNAISCNDMIEVISKLPVNVLKRVLNYAEQYNKNITDLLKVRVPTGVNPETNQIEYIDQEVQVNGNFFIIS